MPGMALITRRKFLAGAAAGVASIPQLDAELHRGSFIELNGDFENRWAKSIAEIISDLDTALGENPKVKSIRME